MVDITEEDREAAARQVEWLREATLEWENIEPFFISDFAVGVRKGTWDEHPFVQAFARHRTESTAKLQADLAEALGALEALCDFGSECTQDKWDNARAILAILAKHKEASDEA